MPLTNMKRTKAEVKSEMPEVSDTPKEEYPYGLVISLDDAEIEKLGIDMTAVGEDVTIYAKATVKSASESEYEGEKKRRSMSLQITDLAVDTNNSKVAGFYKGD